VLGAGANDFNAVVVCPSHYFASRPDREDGHMIALHRMGACVSFLLFASGFSGDSPFGTMQGPHTPDTMRRRHTEQLAGAPDSKNCYNASAALTDSSCNCFGGHDRLRLRKMSSRPTIKIIVGGWTAAALDAFLLKIVIEEFLEFPVQLIDDVELLDRFGELGIFEALSRGDAHMYPEVTCPDPKSKLECAWRMVEKWASGVAVSRRRRVRPFRNRCKDSLPHCPHTFTRTHPHLAPADAPADAPIHTS
jgi:hypothetical protein